MPRRDKHQRVRRRERRLGDILEVDLVYLVDLVDCLLPTRCIPHNFLMGD